MKEILMAEKEMVFLVLLYLHALLKVISSMGFFHGSEIVQMVSNHAMHHRILV